MPKYTKSNKAQSKPYARSKQPNEKTNKPVTDTKKKPISKSEKVKNADLTNQLDNLMDDLSQQLAPPKKTQKKDKIQEQRRLEEEQKRYEQTQNDMDDALGLLTRL